MRDDNVLEQIYDMWLIYIVVLLLSLSQVQSHISNFVSQQLFGFLSACSHWSTRHSSEGVSTAISLMERSTGRKSILTSSQQSRLEDAKSEIKEILRSLGITPSETSLIPKGVRLNCDDKHLNILDLLKEVTELSALEVPSEDCLLLSQRICGIVL